ncbi:hypothetical protein ABXT66_01515 [Candidatus Levibacter sp. Uisw_134_01]|uniref:hypothetical protein n=1 Tax=Candidatus Levibacter sp. Uisw_134_01 TaxID=3230999 RepID=UPI003D3A8233
MAETKAQKIKSDKETIIDMEPVKEESNKSDYKNPAFLISFITLVLTITILSWIILYHIPKLSEAETNRVNIIIKEIEKDNKKNNKFVVLTEEIKKIKSQILEISNNKNEVTSEDFKNLSSSVMSLKDELKLITNKKIPQEVDNKNLDYQKNNTVNYNKNLDSSVQNNFSSSSVSLKRKQASLILETQIIIDKLLAREDLASTSNEQINVNELDLLSRLKNYLAGFFKLRQYSNNSTPRAIITKAETELKNGNLSQCLKLLKTLPDNWKRPINEFIIKTEIYLNRTIKVTE